MSVRRRALASGLCLWGGLALTGCTKPAPAVTVWSGTHSVHAEANCWQFAKQTPLSPKECPQEVLTKATAGEGVPRVAVRGGNIIGISVDPVVAAGGWSVLVAGQTLGSNLTDSYHRFTFPETGATDPAGYSLQVVAGAQPSGARGYWFFQLSPS